MAVTPEHVPGQPEQGAAAHLQGPPTGSGRWRTKPEVDQARGRLGPGGRRLEIPFGVLTSKLTHNRGRNAWMSNPQVVIIPLRKRPGHIFQKTLELLGDGVTNMLLETVGFPTPVKFKY